MQRHVGALLKRLLEHVVRLVVDVGCGHLKSVFGAICTSIVGPVSLSLSFATSRGWLLSNRARLVTPPCGINLRIQA